jgi:hypothetical protein
VVNFGVKYPIIKYVSDKYAYIDNFALPLTILNGSGFNDILELRGKDDIGNKNYHPDFSASD